MDQVQESSPNPYLAVVQDRIQLERGMARELDRETAKELDQETDWELVREPALVLLSER